MNNTKTVQTLKLAVLDAIEYATQHGEYQLANTYANLLRDYVNPVVKEALVNEAN